MPTASRTRRASATAGSVPLDVLARPGLRGLARDVARGLRGHDVALYAAGVTFYAAIGLVPLLLLAVWLSSLLSDPASVRSMAQSVAVHLPGTLGAQSSVRWLVDNGSDFRPGAAIAAVVPATLYGEGLVRAFDRLALAGDRGRRSLRGRLGSLLIVAVSPVLLLAGLAVTNWLTHALGDGLGYRLLGIYLAFLVGWVTLSVLLLIAFRALAPEPLALRTLLWGALGTASFLSGFSLGWLLFLTFHIPVQKAYGGALPVAAGAVSLLWLWLLHILTLLGYVVTLELAAREGHPLGPVVAADPVRDLAHEPVHDPAA